MEDEIIHSVVEPITEEVVRRVNPLLIAAGTFLAGVGIGYFLGKKFARPKYEVHTVQKNPLNFKKMREEAGLTEEDIPDQSFEEIRKQAVESEGDDPAARMYIQMTREETIEVESEEVVVLGEDRIVHSQFEDGTEDIWNYAEEEQHRSETRPYVLSAAEFRDDEKDYSQLTLTYYEGDRTLSDEDDEIVPNHSMVIGPLLFGHGSGDPNVYYVRNDRLKAEYEVLRHPGKYEVELAGLQEENEQARQFVRDIKRQRGQQRFRPEDDEDDG